MNIEQYKAHIQRAFENAQQGISKCSSEILAMDGMTGKKTRHLYNNLLNMPDARYLEVGVWLGSSFCSALYNNTLTYAYASDNWSEYGGPKDQFEANVKKYKGTNDVHFLEGDFKLLDVATLPKFNIYLFDGGHDYEDHVLALWHVIDCLDDVFIYIIDDWNWISVREGTKFSLHQYDCTILHGVEIRMTTDDTHTEHTVAKEEFWNGVCVLLVKKNSPSTV